MLKTNNISANILATIRCLC